MNYPGTYQEQLEQLGFALLIGCFASWELPKVFARIAELEKLVAMPEVE